MKNQVIEELERYVQGTLGVPLSIQPWSGGRNLPFFLKDQYAFFQAKIADLSCILIVAGGEQESTPAMIRKHVDLVQPRAGGEALIYVQKQMSSYNRKRLIDQKVSFIVPGNQMYLLPLGVDLRERFKRARTQAKSLSPSAQVVLLHTLLKSPQRILALNDLALQYGYSAMTMSRAFSEIDSLGLFEISIRKRKRERILKGTKLEIWEKTLDYLRSPVIRRLYVDPSINLPDGVCAGLSALARYSTLAEPGNKVLAVGNVTGKLLIQKYGREALSRKDVQDYEIEVWSYEPALFAMDGVVDRLSLFLSLRDEEDERVEAALEQMMREMQW